MPHKVLMIDDSIDNIEFVKAYVSSECDFIEADNGKRGLELAKQEKPELILLDIYMPDIDGFDVLTQLQTEPVTKDIPVIFLSAYGEKDNIVKGLDAGAVDYITKPFHPSELLARIRSQLRLVDSEKALRESTLELAHLNSTKDKFISIIGDRLLRPIRQINQILKIMYHKNADMDQTTQQDYLDIAFSASSGINEMANGLMEWSDLNSPNFSITQEEIEPNDLLNDVIHELQPRANEKHQTIEIDTDFDKAIIVADRRLITDVIKHTLSNAINFSEYNTNIQIKGSASEAFLSINIEDHGVGISPENLEKLFLLDEHLSTLGTDGEIGTGMGLILCKEILQKTGGSIDISSQLGEGTQVTIRLPVNAADPDKNN